jgi:soluble lytic murein transglycosylase-like protein
MAPLLSRSHWFAGIISAGLAVAFGQPPPDFEKSVRAAMAKSLAQQKLSIQRQVAAVRAQTPAGVSSVTITTEPVTAADCDPLASDELDPLIEESAEKEGVNPDLVRAVINQESAARPCVVSDKGAQGLMQLMPATAGQFEVRDPFDPKQNIDAGTRLLKLLLDRYDNDIPLALGAYNAGPSRVDRQGGVPQIPETLNYVTRILQQLGPADNHKP